MKIKTIAGLALAAALAAPYAAAGSLDGGAGLQRVATLRGGTGLIAHIRQLLSALWPEASNQSVTDSGSALGDGIGLQQGSLDRPAPLLKK